MIRAKNLRINDILKNDDNYVRVCQVADLDYHNSQADEYDYAYNIKCKFLLTDNIWSFTEDELDGVVVTEKILLDSGFCVTENDTYSFDNKNVHIIIRMLFKALPIIEVFNKVTFSNIRHCVSKDSEITVFIHTIQHLISDVDAEDIDWKIN